MTARERHGLTERAIDSILRNTACPYRLVYADGSTPDALRERLQARAADGSFEVVRVDPDLWPTHVRRKLVATVDSDYVVFVDNDVIVEPGWLEALIACADETGAGAVGPLYLIGGGDAPTRVHMAGGTLEWIDTPTGRVLRELHVDAGSDPGSSPTPRSARRADTSNTTACSCAPPPFGTVLRSIRRSSASTSTSTSRSRSRSAATRRGASPGRA
jgi:glycosyltransferase involved in cell wall biosynthesis